MAYPIKLFDETAEDGMKKILDFLKNLDKTLTDLFGIISKEEKTRKYHKWEVNTVPDFLIDIAKDSVLKIMKKLPAGDMKWKGTVNVCGRKTGSLIKSEKDVLYRLIIHIGETEIYQLDNNPVALPNGYGLLCSPSVIENAEIRVSNEPIRKKLDKELIGLVPKIRSKEYIRSTIVLDLLNEGLSLSEVKGEFCDHEHNECCDHNDHEHNECCDHNDEQSWSHGQASGTVETGYIKDVTDQDLLAHHSKSMTLSSQVDDNKNDIINQGLVMEMTGNDKIHVRSLIPDNSDE